MNREHCRSRDLKNTYLWVNREGHYGERYEEILLRRRFPDCSAFTKLRKMTRRDLCIY